LSWHEWGKRVDKYIKYIDRLFSPDLVIVGGGVSRKWEKYSQAFSKTPDVVPAVLENQAGIVGAAVTAAADIHNP